MVWIFSLDPPLDYREKLQHPPPNIYWIATINFTINIVIKNALSI